MVHQARMLRLKEAEALMFEVFGAMYARTEKLSKVIAFADKWMRVLREVGSKAGGYESLSRLEIDNSVSRAHSSPAKKCPATATDKLRAKDAFHNLTNKQATLYALKSDVGD